MANKAKGEVELKVGEAYYTLVYDLNALCEIEEALSRGPYVVTFQQAMARAESGQLTAIRAVLWGGMRRKHPAMTIEKIGTLLGDLGDQAKDVIERAFRAAMPDQKEADGNPPEARSDGTGTTSSSGPEVSASLGTNSGA